MVDSQSLGRENSGRYARQRASEVGLLYLTWVSKPLLNCPLGLPLQCNRIRQRRVRCWISPAPEGQFSGEKRANLCRVPDIANYFSSSVVQKSIVMRFDRAIALTGCALETFQVEDLDVSSAVTDETGLLESIRD